MKAQVAGECGGMYAKAYAAKDKTHGKLYAGVISPYWTTRIK